MSEALAEIREGFSKKEIKMAIGVASDPRYKQGNYSGAVRTIEKIKKGLSKHPQVAAVLKRQNEEIFEKVKCPHCEGDGCPKCEGNGYMADAVDKEDEPFLKDLIKNLRKGSATHSKQADDLEKAVKEEVEQVEESKVLDNMSQLPKGMERPLKSMQQVKKDADLGGMKITHIVKNKQGNKVVAAVVSNGKKNFVYVNNKGVAPLKEEVELDEMKEPFAVVDTADGDKVVGTASSEKGAKEIITTAQLPPMKIKDKKTLKIVKTRKKQDIGYPLKEETELDENRAARDARRAMAKDKDMQQRPFDKDDKATAIDIQKGKQNIVVQLKKAMNLGGSKPITFDSGPDKKVDPKFARAALDKLNKIKRSDDKLKFQMKLSKSYKDMLQALKEDYEVELDEGKMKDIAIKMTDIGNAMKGNKTLKPFISKFKKNVQSNGGNLRKGLEDALPDYIAGKEIEKLMKMVEEVEEGTVVESWELNEMKMDDPKLLKIFDKLKKGSTVKIKIDSSISKGKDYREFTVTAKNIVGKGKRFEQEKITLKAKDNPTGVKHFLYNRDGKVTLAIGDMGASIADIKENRMSAYTAAITKGVK